MEALLRLRATLRDHAIAKQPLDAKELWGICDEYRDRVLPDEVGVAVKDLRGGQYSWEWVSRDAAKPIE